MRTGTMASTKRMFDDTKRRLSVVTFYKGQRKLTYGGLSLDQAMQEIRVKTKRGLHAIICIDLPAGMLGNKVEEFKNYMW